ncbi:MAG: arginine deiminase-related protein [Flavobacteriaceae bacterium]
MKSFCVKDETAPLKAVIVGRATSNGPTPSIDEAYDPKSIEHLKAGTYPAESDMIREIEGLAEKLKSLGVEVYRPELIENYNQIFSRDIGFVVDDNFVYSNILPDREDELAAVKPILDLFDPSKILSPPEEVHVEGGDVMPHKEFLFVGTYLQEDYRSYITARTNKAAVDWLGEAFNKREVKAFELKKSNTDPYTNALHLDCCFQPVGEKYAIIHKDGFLHEQDAEWLINYFEKENVFEISAEEMYAMNSNIFSVAPDLVISDVRFNRLNHWLNDKGIRVEAIPYGEIAKQEGLLRCSTLPLIRHY